MVCVAIIIFIILADMTDTNIEETTRKVLTEAFRMFDTDKSGSIELHELAELLRRLTDSFHVESPSE